MLQAFPTKNGTGVSIFGDYGDLQMLYQTIHHFSETLDENRNPQKAQHLLLMNFAYEVRKAFSGKRLVNKFSYPGDDLKSVFEKAKKGQLEPLTPAKLRKHPELQNISEEDALAAIDTIKKLAAIFFEIAHHKETICIDNQEVVNLNQENRAA